MSVKKQLPADVLRKAGFVPLPRLWVKREDMRTIHMIAGQYADEVNHIRGQIQRFNQRIDESHHFRNQKEKEIEMAWQSRG
jgi:hypothetical protein